MKVLTRWKAKFKRENLSRKGDMKWKISWLWSNLQHRVFFVLIRQHWNHQWWYWRGLGRQSWSPASHYDRKIALHPSQRPRYASSPPKRGTFLPSNVRECSKNVSRLKYLLGGEFPIEWRIIGVKNINEEGVAERF